MIRQIKYLNAITPLQPNVYHIQLEYYSSNEMISLDYKINKLLGNQFWNLQGANC
jgi:hypothetical protein